MVYRISTSQLAQNGLDGILKNQANMSNIISQISSGLRNDLDPVEKAQQLSYSVKISDTAQNIRNGETVLPQLTAQDSALSSLSEQLINLQETMTESQNPAIYDKNITQLSVDSIKTSILGIMNTRDSEGNYIFSGYQSKTQAFSDLNTYNGDQGVNKIRIADNSLVDINTPGDSVVGRNLTDAFSKMQDFIDTGKSDGSMFESLRKAISDVSIVQTKVGTNINRINDFKNLNNEFSVLDQSRLSQIQDADITSLAAQLGNAKNATEAAMKSYSVIQNLSLFNYM